MKIAIAGYSGFIGKAVRNKLEGNEFILLDREILYGDAEVLARRIEGAEVLMNFAGFNVSKRWTPKHRKKILDSRVLVTRNLVKAARKLENPPKFLVFASAIGIYSNEGTHTEKSENFGEGFLADVVRKWEAEMDSEELKGRFRIVRIGMVLGEGGGAFPLLKTIFKWYAGAILGSGKQVYSFIHIDDLVRIIERCMQEDISGVVNGTAPHPVTNREFSKELARALGRPLFMKVPAFILRILLGKSADIVLKGQTVLPGKMTDAGFRFDYPEISNAFKQLVDRK